MRWPRQERLFVSRRHFPRSSSSAKTKLQRRTIIPLYFIYRGDITMNLAGNIFWSLTKEEVTDSEGRDINQTAWLQDSRGTVCPIRNSRYRLVLVSGLATPRPPQIAEVGLFCGGTLDAWAAIARINSCFETALHSFARVVFDV